MKERRVWSRGWRGGVVILAGVLMGAMLIQPAVGHVTKKLAHLTKHLDPRYYNVGEKVGDANTLDGIDSSGFARTGAAPTAHNHDERYFTETESDARYYNVGEKVGDADTLDTLNSTAFMRSAVYTVDPAPAAGTDLGDGTFYIDQACLAGDRLLSGGPANVAATSDVVESFPFGTNTWRGRINKNGMTDNFNVVVLCADQ